MSSKQTIFKVSTFKAAAIAAEAKGVPFIRIVDRDDKKTFAQDTKYYNVETRVAPNSSGDYDYTRAKLGWISTGKPLVNSYNNNKPQDNKKSKEQARGLQLGFDQASSDPEFIEVVKIISDALIKAYEIAEPFLDVCDRKIAKFYTTVYGRDNEKRELRGMPIPNPWFYAKFVCGKKFGNTNIVDYRGTPGKPMTFESEDEKEEQLRARLVGGEEVHKLVINFDTCARTKLWITTTVNISEVNIDFTTSGKSINTGDFDNDVVICATSSSTPATPVQPAGDFDNEEPSAEDASPPSPPKKVVEKPAAVTPKAVAPPKSVKPPAKPLASARAKAPAGDDFANDM